MSHVPLDYPNVLFMPAMRGRLRSPRSLPRFDRHLLPELVEGHGESLSDIMFGVGSDLVPMSYGIAAYLDLAGMLAPETEHFLILPEDTPQHIVEMLSARGAVYALGLGGAFSAVAQPLISGEDVVFDPDAGVPAFHDNGFTGPLGDRHCRSFAQAHLVSAANSLGAELSRIIAALGAGNVMYSYDAPQSNELLSLASLGFLDEGEKALLASVRLPDYVEEAACGAWLESFVSARNPVYGRLPDLPEGKLEGKLRVVKRAWEMAKPCELAPPSGRYRSRWADFVEELGHDTGVDVILEAVLTEGVPIEFAAPDDIVRDHYLRRIERVGRKA